MSQLSWDSLTSGNGSSRCSSTPQKTCPPRTHEEKVFGDVIKLRMLRWGHPGSGQALNPMARVLVRGRRGEDTEVEEERAGRGEDGGSFVATKQGIPDSAEAGRGKEGFFPGDAGSRVAWCALILDFWPPGYVSVLSLQDVVMCQGSPRKRIQTRRARSVMRRHSMERQVTLDRSEIS